MLALAVVLPAALGGVALAGSGSPGTPASVNSALSWMAIRDSAGVPLSQYMFVTDRGGVLNPGNTVLSTIISLEFAGWVVIVTTAIWIIGYALSFQWLASIGSALEGVATNLSGQLATPLMLVTAAGIGAFFVAYFIVRGHSSKAVAQVCTMVLVAIAGPFFLAHPLEDALAADGVLAKGRDVGITVAAGLNGSAEVNPMRLVATIQTTLADNLARRPLQVWNFGHVIDDRPACAGVWNAGMLAGDEDRVKDGLRGCGDTAAFAAASNPGAGQIGAGLLMLLTSLIVCGLGVMLAWRILRAGMRTLKHGIYAIFGFAAGGFVYGPTQSFLVYNIVDGLIAAAAMVVNTIALGAACLFYGNLFRQAGGQVMAVLVISAGAGLVLIVELNLLNRRIAGGTEWITERIGNAMRGESGRTAGGGGGGTGTGAGAAGSIGGLGLLNTLAAVSTINSSPVTEWVWGRTRNPLRPRSRQERGMQEALWGMYNAPGLGGPTGWMVQAQLGREQLAVAARSGAVHGGGIDTPRGAAAAIRRLRNSGGLLDSAYGALTGAGFADREIMARAVRSWGMMEDNAEDETLANKHLGHVVAAMQNVGHASDRLIAGNGDPDEMVSHLATLEAVAHRWRNAHAGGVTLDGGAVTGVQRRYVEDYMRNPTMQKLKDLQSVADGNSTPATLRGIDRNAAGRMMKWIGNEHAKLTTESVDSILRDIADPQRMRDARAVITAATDTDLWSSGVQRGTWHTVTPPGTHRADVAAWRRAMAPVEERLR